MLYIFFSCRLFFPLSHGGHNLISDTGSRSRVTFFFYCEHAFLNNYSLQVKALVRMWIDVNFIIYKPISQPWIS